MCGKFAYTKTTKTHINDKVGPCFHSDKLDF